MASKVLPQVDSPQLLLSSAPPVEVPPHLVSKQKTMLGAVQLCCQLSGLEEKEIYRPLAIDPGQWTRIMKGEAHFPTNRYGDLMDVCANEAPLDWLAWSRGRGTHMLKSEAERRAEDAEARAVKAEERLAYAEGLLMARPK